MIYGFGGRNFFSFRDEFAVDFRVKVQASDRDIFHSDSAGQRVNAVMGVFGANASGKTQLLKALGFLQWFMQDSAHSEKPDAQIMPLHFKLAGEPASATELFLEFEMDGSHYRYEVELTPERVLREGLYRRKTKFSYLFERTWNGAEKAYRLKAQDFAGEGLQAAQRRNASLLSTALLLEHPFARKVDRFLNSCYGNLCHVGRTERNDPLIENLFETAEFFLEHRELLEWVNSRLAHFDLGLDAIDIEKRKLLLAEGKEVEQAVPFGVHRHGGKEFRLSLMAEESRGTQALFVLLRYILPVLKSGGLAYIDEFELGLHSHMIPRLIDLFYSQKHNDKNAQLLFSTHADYVIQRLEKYQMVLVEKDDDGVSAAYRLDEVEGVRNVDNHYAKYHAGAYGGIPRI